eukprot:3879330-Prymnesium_polylepis.1
MIHRALSRGWCTILDAVVRQVEVLRMARHAVSHLVHQHLARGFVIWTAYRVSTLRQHDLLSRSL